MTRPLRWAAFVSGRGSNLEAFLRSDETASTVLVVSNSPKAKALARAKFHGLPLHILTGSAGWSVLPFVLAKHKVEAIFLLGFMKILPEDFIHTFNGPILNLHPSLLPEFPGLKSIERAYAEGADLGVTVHHVVGKVDSGPLVFQKGSIRPKAALTLESAEYFVHQTEQMLVRKVASEWRV